MDFDLGARLRSLREQHGLSQRELAKRAGVTNGTISAIEQNRTSPAVGSLKKVLDGFPIALSEFFANDFSSHRKIFFQASELTPITEGNIEYKQIGRDLTGKALQVLHEHYAPGADTGRTLLSHQGEEAGVVVKGRLEVTVGSERKILKAGDAFYFESHRPHRFRCVGEEDAIVISACTPPSF
ncbi:cupin domain-containing protein [Sneathiella chinensis]|uniref:XRE family transcriptional regulator n=1 Tax=Sneathiella chinensis TaxID=349750 RepID=A0ABQ5UBQ2_9PROT|nr:cupin domain-containing protein [Sneathiella chinensis]GLQ07991.1 XRE family transcriptional regulator [Sneathiella chinensis]